jgi:hypothetical protein
MRRNAREEELGGYHGGSFEEMERNRVLDRGGRDEIDNERGEEGKEVRSLMDGQKAPLCTVEVRSNVYLINNT